jgi:hypothetical protein
MARGVSMFIAKDVTVDQAEKLRELARFSVGAPFRLVPVLDPSLEIEVYPMRSSEIVELAGAIVARALEEGGHT